MSELGLCCGCRGSGKMIIPAGERQAGPDYGWYPKKVIDPCPTCGGGGKVTQYTSICKTCKGSGRVHGSECDVCKGYGRIG